MSISNLYILGSGYIDSPSVTLSLSALKVFTYIEGTSYSWVASSTDYDYRLYNDGSTWAIYDNDNSGLGNLWELTDDNKHSSFTSTNPTGTFTPNSTNSSIVSGSIYVSSKLGKLTRNYTTDILRTWYKVRTKRKTGRQIKTNDTDFGPITGHWFLSGADTGYDRKWYNSVTDEDNPSDGWLLYYDPYGSVGPYPDTWAIKSLASGDMYYRGFPCDEDDGTKDVAWNPSTGRWRGMHQGPCGDNPRGVYYSVHDSASGRVRLHDEYPNTKMFWNTHKSQTWTDDDEDNVIDDSELESTGAIGNLINTYTVATTSVLISSTDVCGANFNIVSDGSLKSQRDEGKRYTTGKTDHRSLTYIGAGNTHPNQRAITPAFGTGVRNTKHFPFTDDVNTVLNKVDARRVKGDVGDTPENTVNADGSPLVLKSGSGSSMGAVTANNVLWLDADHAESFNEPNKWKDRSPSAAHATINTTVSGHQFLRYKDAKYTNAWDTLSGRYVVSNVLWDDSAAYSFSFTNHDFNALSAADSFSIFYVARVPRDSNYRNEYLFHIGDTGDDKYYRPGSSQSVDFGPGTRVGTTNYPEFLEIHTDINTGVTPSGQLSGSDPYVYYDYWGPSEGGHFIAQGNNYASDYYIRSIIFDSGSLSTHLDGEPTTTDLQTNSAAKDAYGNSTSLTSLPDTINHTKGYGLLGQGSTSHPANARLAELLIYDAALDDTNRETVEGYLAHKWNRTDEIYQRGTDGQIDYHPYGAAIGDTATQPEGYSADPPTLGLTSQYSVTSRYVDTVASDLAHWNSSTMSNSLFINNSGDRVIFDDNNFDNPTGPYNTRILGRILVYDIVDDVLTEVCSISSSATHDWNGTAERFRYFRALDVSKENNICAVAGDGYRDRGDGNPYYGPIGLSSIQLTDSFSGINHTYEDKDFYHGTIIEQDTLGSNETIADVSLSEDGSRCVVCYRQNYYASTAKAKYRVYEYDTGTSTWSTLGQELTGREYNRYPHCRISGDGSRIVIGEAGNIDGSSTGFSTAMNQTHTNYLGHYGLEGTVNEKYNEALKDSGTLTIYEMSGGEWVTVGVPISGALPMEGREFFNGLYVRYYTYYPSLLGAFGIDINYDGTIVAGVEAQIYNHLDAGADPGQGQGVIRVWSENNGIWSQRGQDIRPSRLYGPTESRLGVYTLKLDRTGTKLVANERDSESRIYGDVSNPNHTSFHISRYNSTSNVWINEYVEDPDRAYNELSYRAVDIDSTGDYIIAADPELFGHSYNEVVLYKHTPTIEDSIINTGSNFELAFTDADVYEIASGMRKKETLIVSPSSRNHLYFHTIDQTQRYRDLPFIIQDDIKTDGIFQTYTSEHTGILETIFFKTSGCFTAGFTLTAHRGTFDADNMTSFTSTEKLKEVTVLPSDTQPYGKIEIELDIPVIQGEQYIFEFGGDCKLVDPNDIEIPLHMYAIQSIGVSGINSGVLDSQGLLSYSCGFIGTSNWPRSFVDSNAWSQAAITEVGGNITNIEYAWTSLWFEAKVYDTIEKKTAICTYNGWKWDRMDVVWNTEYREYQDITD